MPETTDLRSQTAENTSIERVVDRSSSQNWFEYPIVVHPHHMQNEFMGDGVKWLYFL